MVSRRAAQPEPPQGLTIARTSAARTLSPLAMVARMKSMHSALCEGQSLVSIDSVGRWLAFTLPEFRGRQAPPNCYRENFSRDRAASKISAY
jgi:hypothetical protein